MKSIGIVCALIAVLALPAGATAKPTRVDKKAAAKTCKVGRKQVGKRKFVRKYARTAKRAKNRKAFRKCVVRASRATERSRRNVRRQSAKACARDLRADRKAFFKRYGDQMKAMARCVAGDLKHYGFTRAGTPLPGHTNAKPRPASDPTPGGLPPGDDGTGGTDTGGDTTGGDTTGG